MTEEQFHYINNLVQATAEQLRSLGREFEKRDREFERRDREIEKHNEAIRSLIIVARTVLDSIREDRERHERDYAEMRAQSKMTEEKLNILVETVDRIIRHRDTEK
jgi:hypothetical protein